MSYFVVNYVTLHARIAAACKLLTFSMVGDKLGISMTMCSGREKARFPKLPITDLLLTFLAERNPILEKLVIVTWLFAAVADAGIRMRPKDDLAPPAYRSLL